jgi:glyoxylase-like metal-dependent hydrolase (beta-lactamase superfamily II)
MDVIEVLPCLHMLRFEVGAAYLWSDGDALTLIDTGPPGSGTGIARAVRERGFGPERLRRIVLTHFHADHAGAAAEVREWSGAAVMAHPLDAPVVRGEAPGPPPVLSAAERALFDGLPPLPPAPPSRVDREVADGEILGFGGGARVVGVPGHTDGSVALHLPEHGVLFTGDVAANVGGRTTHGVFHTDPARAAASFRLLGTLGADVACFGHGDPLVGGAAAALRAAEGREAV